MQSIGVWRNEKLGAIFNFKLVRTRILAVFSLLLIFVLCFTAYTAVKNQHIKHDVEHIANEDLKQLTYSQQLSVSIATREAAALHYLISGDDTYKETFLASQTEATQLAAQLNAIAASEKRQTLVDDAVKWNDIVTERVFPLYEKGQKAKAIALLQKNSELAENVRVGYADLSEAETKEMEAGSVSVSDAAKAVSLRSLLFGITIIIVGIALAFYTASFISKPIQVVVSRMKQLASGNLTAKTEKIDRQDELGQLFNTTTDLNETLSDMLQAVQHVSQNVNANSAELAQSSSDVKMATHQISEVMQQLAKGADKQAQKSVDLSTSMTQFSHHIEAATVKSTMLKNDSSNVQELAHEGRTLMIASTDQMKTIHHIMQQAVLKVEQLNNQSVEITQLVQVIETIASQTNLLALNASIEAARAGEHGKGFAVVADEVRQLAEQVNHSVTDIAAIVSRMQHETSTVRDSLQQGYEEVQRGTTQITTTSGTFGHILSAIDQLTVNVDTISTTLSDIQLSTMTIHTSVQESAALAEQSATSVEQTSATVQQAAQTMEGISNSADELSTMAETLNTALAKFQLATPPSSMH